MIISGNVIAHKLIADGIAIDDNISCQLPSIDTQTGEIKGAGIMGAIDLPSTGQIGSLTFTVNMRAINRSSVNLAKPGVQNIEVRFVKDVLNANGQMVSQSGKVFITGINKKYDPGKVESTTTMDGSAEFEVLRYRQIIDGVETLLIDKRNYIYKVNGIDYMEKVRATLG